MVSSKETKLYSEAIALAGYGKYNLFLLLATGGCLMCVIVETMCMSFIIPAAQCDLNLSLAQKGILVSIGFLGVISTSFFWGFVADVRGRRNLLIFCLIASSAISLVCSIVPWAWLFILLRFMNGALIGGASSIIYAYAGEFHDDRRRPMVISWISSFVAAGQCYIPGMAWAILPHEWSYEIEALGIDFRPWRFLMIIYALPSLIVAALLSCLPESPKFLLAQGRHDETMKILTQMFVVNTGRKSHEFPVDTVVLDEINLKKSDKTPNMFKFLWKQTRFLFQKGYFLKTVLCCYLQFGVFLSASALSLWFPDIINTLSKHAQTVGNSEVSLCGAIDDTTIVQTNSRSIWSRYFAEVNLRNVTLDEDAICNDSVDTGVFLVILLIGVAIGITYIIIGIVINHVGKKMLVVGAASVTAACGLTAQYIQGFEAILILCGIYLLIASMVGVVNGIAVDLYPTHIRAMALAVSLMFGRLGAMIGSNVVGVVYYSYCQWMFIFFAINHLILIVAAILLPTRKVQECMNNAKL